MDQRQFEAITSKLDKIIRLLGANAVQNRNVEQSILYLSSLGFQPSEIGLILGRSANQVSVTLSVNKKKKASEKQDGEEGNADASNTGEA